MGGQLAPVGWGLWRVCLEAVRPVWSGAASVGVRRLLETIMVRLDQALIGAVFGAATLGYMPWRAHFRCAVPGDLWADCLGRCCLHGEGGQ